VYWNVLDYLRALDAFPAFHERFDEADYLAILLAGLLHDVGHYPFSHQLDNLPEFPEHEALTIALIKGDLQLYGENLGNLIEDLFGIEPSRIAALLEPGKKMTGKLGLLRQIIDSPLDADKCDYLPRDSYFCGLDFGSAFDRTRLISNLLPDLDGEKMAIHEKGLVSAERLQLARYWMYRSVYWGHTVRSLISMLARACQNIEEVPEERDWYELLLTSNDQDMLSWLVTACDEAGRELIDMLMIQRRPYKRLYTLSYNHDPETYRQLQRPEVQRQVLERVKAWGRSHGENWPDYYLIWDVPPTYKDKAWETFPVVLSDGSQTAIEKESPVVQALGPAFLTGVRKIRLYYHPDLRNRVPMDQVPGIETMLEG